MRISKIKTIEVVAFFGRKFSVKRAMLRCKLLLRMRFIMFNHNFCRTLLSQISYAIGYPLPVFNWYIPRDPSNETLEQQMASIGAVPFFGSVIPPLRISLNKEMSQSDQRLFAAAAMRAWTEDKEGRVTQRSVFERSYAIFVILSAELKHCADPTANCFIAVVPGNPTVLSGARYEASMVVSYFRADVSFDILENCHTMRPKFDQTLQERMDALSKIFFMLTSC